MKTQTLPVGTVHDKMPGDLHKALSANKESLSLLGATSPRLPAMNGSVGLKMPNCSIPASAASSGLPAS